MIRQSKILSLGQHVQGFTPNSRIIAALRVDDHSQARLIEAGFSNPIDEGQSVLPSAHLGRAAAFNAEGREEIHRGQPKETIYRQAEWTHEQWNGPHTETVTEIVTRPYERFPRSFIDPPSVELTIRRSADGVLFVCAPARRLGRDDEILVQDVNLILDIAKECELLSQDLVSPLRGNLRRLNWDVLPRGHYPWNRLQPLVRPAIERLPPAAKPVIEHRLDIVSRYPHDFVAVGKAGFSGYVIFGFPVLGIHVLECTHEGNATYVFGNDWEELSQWTKAEVLSENRQLHRLIHSRNWAYALGDIMRQHGY